jgi:tetratricopeptide (TPR) repeat protein
MRDRRLRREMMLRRVAAVLACGTVLAAACATRLAPPPVVTAPAHPDYLYPEVPGSFTRPEPAQRLERGWAFLQAGDPTGAEREFAAALKADPRFYPADAGMAYARLAAGDPARAETGFGRVLANDPTYVPALVGRGDSLLALGRADQAVTAYEAALAARPDLVDVRRRLETVSFRSQQAALTSAREAAAAGRDTEATEAYEQAIASSPDSAFLYRELAAVERRQGQRTRALEHLRRATALDPGDRQAWLSIGELLAEARDFAGAVSVYERAAALDPGDDVNERLEAARRGLALSRLPREYAEIAEEPILTRGQLAALIGVHLADLVEANQRRPGVVLTDARGHWAAPWVLGVVRAGLMDAFPNHTFGPRAPVRRLEVARAVRRVLDLVAPRRPALARQWNEARPAIADVPFSHLGYPATAVAVASGVMRLRDGGFGPTEPVSGAEALAIIERLEELAR